MTQAKVQPRQGARKLPGDERRRSQRVMIRVPVTLYVTLANKEVTIHAVTVAVNDHGAMLLCSRTLPTDTRLELQHDRTRQQLPCRIKRVPRESPEGYLVPVEFDTPTAGFWHISFPPPDWRPVEE